MRIVFAGSPAAAVPSLEQIADEHEVVAVVTRAPSPVGRRRTLTPTPVADAAARLGLQVIATDRLDADATAQIADLAPDLGVIVAYGGLVREPLLSTPAHGWVNLHFSLLPAYRGAAPVQHALLEGRSTTGVAVFQLVEQLDAGPIHGMVEVPVPPLVTAGTLLEQLSVTGARVLVDAVTDIERGVATPVEQAGEPSLAPKLSLVDGELDASEPAARVLDRFRAVTPEPGAHVTIDGARVKVLDLARSAADPLEPGTVALVGREAVLGTATSSLALLQVQPAGKRPMAAADWLRGRGGSARIESGTTAEAGEQRRG